MSGLIGAHQMRPNILIFFKMGHSYTPSPELTLLLRFQPAAAVTSTKYEVVSDTSVMQKLRRKSDERLRTCCLKLRSASHKSLPTGNKAPGPGNAALSCVSKGVLKRVLFLPQLRVRVTWLKKYRFLHGQT